MNVEELSMIGPDVDLETVDAINKKRLLAFFNHFVISTTLFLNKLSKSCEHGLQSLENKIQKLEVSIIILESKLNSVPGLEDENRVETLVTDLEPKRDNLEEEKDSIDDKNLIDEPNEIKQTKIQESLDPALMKYVKMIQFGVPAAAVKLKMEQEQIDSSLFESVLNFNK